MNKMIKKGVYARITIVVGLALCITALVISITAGIMTSQMATELSESLIMSKLKGDLNSIKERVKLEFSIFTYDEQNKTLIDVNGKDVRQNTKFVDSILADLGIVATIFVKDGDDFRRLTTSVRKKDGSRAVGTYLGKDSAAYKPVMEGKTYFGPAKILGEPYYTAYEPIFDQGKVVGIIFVGYKKSDLIAYLERFKIKSYSILAFATLMLLVIAVVAARFVLKRGVVDPALIATRDIGGAAEQVGTAARQLTSSSANLADGAQRQAAAVDEVDSIIENITKIADNNEAVARETKKIADEAKESLSKVSETIKHMEDAMRNINISSDKTIKIIKTTDQLACPERCCRSGTGR